LQQTSEDGDCGAQNFSQTAKKSPALRVLVLISKPFELEEVAELVLRAYHAQFR
jgi:hypothetical protein